MTATVTARDGNGNVVEGIDAELAASGAGNGLTQPPATDANGVASGALVTTAAERKTLSARLDPTGAAIDLDAMPQVSFAWDRAATRFVRQGGSDANDGASPVEAWATLTHALASLVAGETLHVGAGTYVESATLAASGTADDPIRIVADTSGAYTGDAGPVVVDASGAVAALDLGDAAWVEVEGFTLTGATGGAEAAAVRVAGSNVTLRGNVLYENELGVRVEGATAWWSTWPYRRPVRFGTAHDELPAGFTVALTLDTRTSATNVALASGDDVRVVWQPAAGGFVELDRLGDVFDDAATTLRFRLPSTVPADADVDDDGTYWVYYGDADAGAAPSDPELVWWFEETFDRADGTVVGNGWSEWNDGGDMHLSGGALVIDPTGDTDPPQLGVRRDFPLGAVPGDFRVTWSWDMPTNAEGIWSFWGMNIGTAGATSSSDRTAGVGVGLYNAESLGVTGTEVMTNDMATALETGINGLHAFRLDVDVSAFTYDYWRDDVLRAADVAFVNPQAVLDEVRFGADNFGADPGEEQSIDDVRIELLVADEPEVAADPEEARPASNGAGVVLERNRISGNAGTGVVLRNAVGAVVRNNLVYANGGMGVLAERGSSEVVLELNTLYANVGDQVHVTDPGSEVTVQDNAVVGGGADGIALGDGSATSTANVVWGNAGGGWSGLAMGAGDQVADPLFVDPDGADGLLGGAGADDDSFHLDAVAPSPALDAGSRSAPSMAFGDGRTAADLTSRSDGVLDGTAPDAGTANVGFHYDASVDVLTRLETGDARLVVGSATERQPRTRAWADASDSWTDDERLLPAAGASRWLACARSPLANDEELVVLAVDDGGACTLDVVFFDGVTQERGPSIAGVGDADARGFQAVFEQQSGEALLVWSDGSATPAFRTRTDGTWSEAAALPLNDGGGPYPETNGAAVRWIELVARPGSDEVQLLFVDAAADLVALTWDGSAWSTASATLLEIDVKTNAVTGTVDHRAFDAAFEDASGDLLAVWSREGAAGFLSASRAAGTDAFGAAVAVGAPTSTPHFLDLAGEPGTDRVAACALGLGDGVERLGLATWDGSAWTDAVEADAQVRDTNDLERGDFMGVTAWLPGGGTALCVYADDDVGVLSWASWSAAGGWTLGADEVVAGMDLLESAVAAGVGGDRVLVALSDASGEVRAFVFDGVGWTATAGGAPLATGVATSDAAPLVLVTPAD